MRSGSALGPKTTIAEPTNAAPGNLTCEQLVANFLAAKGNWDDGSEPEPGPGAPSGAVVHHSTTVFFGTL